MTYNTLTAWKVYKYGPEITPYLDTFHAVLERAEWTQDIAACIIFTTLIK